MIKKNIILPKKPSDLPSDQDLFFESLLKVIKELNDDLYNSFPVGFRYMQLPGTPDPNTILPGRWENVSDDYAAAFFRVEGSYENDAGLTLSAEEFDGGVQEDQMQQISGNLNDIQPSAGIGFGRESSDVDGVFSIGEAVLANSPVSSYVDGRSIVFDSADSTIQGGARTGSETRPVNYTVRIWKRVA